MSQREGELAGVQSKLREMEGKLATLQKRFADVKRELDEPTRTIKKTIVDPVIVSTEMIAQVWARLEKEPGNPAVICSTTDGRITTWRTLGHALEQANALDRKIAAMMINNERSTASGGVEIYTAGAVIVRVYGEEKKAESLFADLEAKIISGIRGSPGYGWSAKYGDLAIRSMAAILATYVLVMNLGTLRDLAAQLVVMANSSPLMVAVGILVIAAFVLWSFRRLDRWMYEAIRRYWPMVVVEIGNGKQREQLASRVRGAVVGGAGAVSLAAIGWLLF